MVEPNQHIEFLAAVYNVKTDREGESRLTFEVSQQELDQIMRLMELTGKLLRVIVVKAD